MARQAHRVPALERRSQTHCHDRVGCAFFSIEGSVYDFSDLANPSAEGKITALSSSVSGPQTTWICAGDSGSETHDRTLLIAGAFWGAVISVLMQWFSEHGFSGWVFIY